MPHVANTTRPHRDRIRIASNYVRLLGSFILGLLLVRLLLRLGTDAYGLIIFLGAGTGLIGSLRETVAVSMVPELGAAYHDTKQDRFPSAYSTAFVLSSALAFASLGIALAIGLALPYCNIPIEMLAAARWFLVAKAVQAFVTVLLSPTSNMFLVTERMVSYNVWTIGEKIADTLAAAVILFGWSQLASAQLVVMYGLVSATLSSGIIIAAAIQISWVDPRLICNRRLMSRTALRGLTRSFGWNSCVTLAINLYTRVTALVMNLTFGLAGNVVFGIAVQVAANVRQLSMGLVTGIDAVAARLNQRQGQSAIRELSYFATRLQALVVLPGVCWLMLYVESFISIWVGGRLENPTETIPILCNVVRILLLGVAVRSLSEGWMRILSGAGHAKKYAPIVLGCGLFNPVLAYLMIQLTTGDLRFVTPTAVLSLLMIVVHGMALPWIVARHLDQPVQRIVGPLFRPLLAATLTGIVAFLWLKIPSESQALTLAWDLALRSLLFGISYLGFAILIATSRQERARFVAWLSGREFDESDANEQIPIPKFLQRRRAPSATSDRP